LPVALLEVSVTEVPLQNVVGPPAAIVGVAGAALTTTFVVPAADVQPLTVTVTEYLPASAVVAIDRVGVRTVDVNPVGPVHE
jgi:hypothetical protein